MMTIPVSDRLTLSLYDSIKTLPAANFQLARQYEIMDAELPGSETDLMAALDRAQAHAQAGQLAEMNEVLHNVRLARSLTLSGYQPGQLAWACYVQAANGHAVTDYSEDNVLSLIEQWSALGLTQGIIESICETLKKNSSPN